MSSPDHEAPLLLRAGFACTSLIAEPQSWINRRVETVELLSHEETRRQVSIDFTLSDERLEMLTVGDGVVVPISVLTKERRRNFDLRDEGGRAVPVLGREQNGTLSHIAVLGAAFDAVPGTPSEDLLEVIEADLRQVVMAPPEEASDALGFLFGSAAEGDRWRGAIVEDPTCLSLLDALWANYVLFAVLPKGGPNRRILKYSYGEGFSFTTDDVRWRDAIRPTRLARRVWKPDRREFIVECPGAWRAASFHAELAIPEELRVELAVIWDFRTEEQIGESDENVDRASLYASAIKEEQQPAVFAVVAPERGGSGIQAALTSLTVAGLLWLGTASGLDASTPGPAVSIVTAGAAFFSGLAAVQGQHRLVKRIFAASRRWLTLVSIAALAASALLALEIPDAEPVKQWRAAAVIVSVAAVRLGWAAIRAPGYCQARNH
jgi:hypothetical protein